MSENTKHKKYVRYAAHCLEMVPAVTDQEYRSIQREMAVEWLKPSGCYYPSVRPDEIEVI